MKKHALLFLGVAMVTAVVPAMVWAQGEKYPLIVIPTGKGPYAFPEGYTTPFDKVEMRVTEKMSPNLFVIHGSSGVDLSHPDASGGRMMILFGPDGVLMVDTNNRQTQEKTLAAIRSVTDGPLKVLVNTHIHSDHTGGNAFFAKQGAVIFAQENLRMDMLNPLRPDGNPGPAPDPAAIPVVTYNYNPAAPGQPAATLNMNAGFAASCSGSATYSAMPDAIVTVPPTSVNGAVRWARCEIGTLWNPHPISRRSSGRRMPTSRTRPTR